MPRYVGRKMLLELDERTASQVAVFDAKSKERLAEVERACRERADGSETSGKPLDSVRFDPRNKNVVVLRYADGSKERVKLDAGSGAFHNLDEDAAGMPPGWKEYMLELKQKEEARLRRLKRQ